MLSIALVLQLMMNLGSVSSPIYQLSIETQKCTYSITLNAYPLTKPNESDRISIPLNLYLIGPKNQLKIQHKGKACQWVLTIFKQVRGKMIKFTQAQGRGTSYQVLSFDTEVETFRQWTQS